MSNPVSLLIIVLLVHGCWAQGNETDGSQETLEELHSFAGNNDHSPEETNDNIHHENGGVIPEDFGRDVPQRMDDNVRHEAVIDVDHEAGQTHGESHIQLPEHHLEGGSEAALDNHELAAIGHQDVLNIDGVHLNEQYGLESSTGGATSTQRVTLYSSTGADIQVPRRQKVIITAAVHLPVNRVNIEPSVVAVRPSVPIEPTIVTDQQLNLTRYPVHYLHRHHGMSAPLDMQTKIIDGIKATSTVASSQSSVTNTQVGAIAVPETTDIRPSRTYTSNTILQQSSTDYVNNHETIRQPALLDSSRHSGYSLLNTVPTVTLSDFYQTPFLSSVQETLSVNVDSTRQSLVSLNRSMQHPSNGTQYNLTLQIISCPSIPVVSTSSVDILSSRQEARTSAITSTTASLARLSVNAWRSTTTATTSKELHLEASSVIVRSVVKNTAKAASTIEIPHVSITVSTSNLLARSSISLFDQMTVSSPVASTTYMLSSSHTTQGSITLSSNNYDNSVSTHESMEPQSSQSYILHTTATTDMHYVDTTVVQNGSVTRSTTLLNSRTTQKALRKTLTSTITQFTQRITSPRISQRQTVPSQAKHTVEERTFVALNPTSIIKIPPPDSTVPPTFLRIKLQMAWYDFCDRETYFRLDIVKICQQHAQRFVQMQQIVFVNEEIRNCGLTSQRRKRFVEIVVDFFLTDMNGKIDIQLTESCGEVLEIGFRTVRGSLFKDKLLASKIIHVHDADTTHTMMTPLSAPYDGMMLGTTVGIAIGVIGGVCCVTLLLLQMLVWRRRRGRNMNIYVPGTRQFSIRSADSYALASVRVKPRPDSGCFNAGLLEDQLMMSSHRVNFSTLAKMSAKPEEMYDEYQILPNNVPKKSAVPFGSEEKNRYSNILPLPHTRVKLNRKSHEPNSDYINANYVTGYKSSSKAYIATQAPMTQTIMDFWQMVWEQQSRVIVMLTAMDEQGLPRCSPYWPDMEGVDFIRLYGDYEIMLMNKDIHDDYIVSHLRLKDIENNLMREVKHIWYTAWPTLGTPDPVSLLRVINAARGHYEHLVPPIVVHCSPGTGRTGTVIAVDICMRQYKEEKITDIYHCVEGIRQERAGAVQTPEQYCLIYRTLNEYAMELTSPSIDSVSLNIQMA